MKRRLRINRLLLILFPIVIVLGGSYYFFVGSNAKNQQVSKEAPSVQENKADKPTLEKLLKTAMEPVGSTMYIWGGGWNEEDTAAGIEARTIGVSSRWEEFFQAQDSSYDFQDTLYQIHDGLDCSGYIGWLIYNTMESQSGKDGYVYLASEMASQFSTFGWGSYVVRSQVTDHRPGDILSNEGHVYLVLGTCSDGSVLLVHSSPPGVRICGADPLNRSDSVAVQLAEKTMSEQFPQWYAKYPDCQVDSSYLTDYDQFRWDNQVFEDVLIWQEKTGEEILAELFED